DATNVCQPLISVITRIDYDHTDKLGSSLKEIAREKSGIIKPGKIVISSSQYVEAYKEIKKIDLYLNIAPDNNLLKLIKDNTYYIESLVKIESLNIGTNITKPPYSATGILEGIEIFIPLKDIINIPEEITRLEKKLLKVKKELDIVCRKLNNQDFLSKAPVEVIEKEEEKADELKDIKERLENHLKTLNSE
ncbi:MAG TPA: hypothetical protein ENI51_03415, partial [Candidatus Atribacteria bacterium]|nr:hypothetical protein [Candidatus Atribacteria bacterium]